MFNQKIVEMKRKIFLCLLITTFIVGCQNESINVEKSEKLHSLGLIKESAADLVKIGYYQPSVNLKTLPTSVDLSVKFPSIGDQGVQGSCVGWAVGYYLKTYQEVVEMGWNPNTYSFSPSWVYNQINSGIDQGARISDAMNLIVNKGADFLSNFPYDQFNWTRQPDAASFVRAAYYKAVSYSVLSNDVNTFKQLLANNSAFVVGLNVYPDFDQISTANPIYDVISGTSRGGHALCIVGYDDSKRAFRFINSWNSTWGLNGYGWISYDLIGNSSLGLQAFVLSDAKNTDPAWQFSVGIKGPSSGTNSGVYTWTASVTSGTNILAPYTYLWEYTYDEVNWFQLSTMNTFTGPLPNGLDLKMRLTVRSANGYVCVARKTVTNTGSSDGKKPIVE